MTENNNEISDRVKEGELISVNLSTQLFSIAIALMGVLGGLFTYLLGMPSTKQYAILFYCVSGISLILYVVSIFSGGKGIHSAKKYISGEKEEKGDTNWFNIQAVTGLFALILTFSLIFFYSEPKDNYLQELKTLNRNIPLIINQDKIINDLSERMDSLEYELNAFKKLEKAH